MTQVANKLQVGQKLWYVPTENRRWTQGTGREVQVFKVGRKWAEIEERNYGKPLRIDVDTLVADDYGYSSPGRCYLSREHYEVAMLTQQTWEKLIRGLEHQWRAPDDVTLQDIHEVMRILHLENESND